MTDLIRVGEEVQGFADLVSVDEKRHHRVAWSQHTQPSVPSPRTTRSYTRFLVRCAAYARHHQQLTWKKKEKIFKR